MGVRQVACKCSNEAVHACPHAKTCLSYVLIFVSCYESVCMHSCAPARMYIWKHFSYKLLGYWLLNIGKVGWCSLDCVGRAPVCACFCCVSMLSEADCIPMCSLHHISLFCWLWMCSQCWLHFSVFTIFHCACCTDCISVRSVGVECISVYSSQYSYCISVFTMLIVFQCVRYACKSILQENMVLLRGIIPEFNQSR